MHHIFNLLRCVLIVLSFAGLSVGHSEAQSIETEAREAVLIDMQTGTVLFDKEAGTVTEPASMTKMMTIYMLFERLKEGSISFDDTFYVSEKAWRKGGSKMFVEVGSHVRVEDLMRGLIVQSGNDAAIVVAEALAGSEEGFARQMTAKARSLGMKTATFKNATGWPDDAHRMSVMDLAIMAMATIRDFPDYYPFYAEKTFTYNGIKQGNRNPLLYRSAGNDGLKTGHTQSAGYGLAASSVREGRRLVLVVNGLPTAKARAREAQKLLDWGFREFSTLNLFAADEEVNRLPVWLGEGSHVATTLSEPLTLTLSRRQRADMRVTVNYSGPVPAPIRQGQQIATLHVELPGRQVKEYPLFARHDVPLLGIMGRVGAAIRHLVWGANG